MPDVRRRNRPGTNTIRYLWRRRSQGGRLRHPLCHNERPTPQSSRHGRWRRVGRGMWRHPDRIFRDAAGQRQEITGVNLDLAEVLSQKERGEP